MNGCFRWGFGCFAREMAAKRSCFVFISCLPAHVRIRNRLGWSWDAAGRNCVCLWGWERLTTCFSFLLARKISVGEGASCWALGIWPEDSVKGSFVFLSFSEPWCFSGHWENDPSTAGISQRRPWSATLYACSATLSAPLLLSANSHRSPTVFDYCAPSAWTWGRSNPGQGEGICRRPSFNQEIGHIQILYWWKLLRWLIMVLAELWSWHMDWPSLWLWRSNCLGCCSIVSFTNRVLPFPPQSILVWPAIAYSGTIRWPTPREYTVTIQSNDARASWRPSSHWSWTYTSRRMSNRGLLFFMRFIVQQRREGMDRMWWILRVRLGKHLRWSCLIKIWGSLYRRGVLIPRLIFLCPSSLDQTGTWALLDWFWTRRPLQQSAKLPLKFLRCPFWCSW